MVAINELSRPAIAAAMKGGTVAWGQVGSASEHVRYSEPLPKRRGRYRSCHCGCGKRHTHRGMANGVMLVGACELGIARWVRTGRVKPMPNPIAVTAGAAVGAAPVIPIAPARD